MSNIEFLTKFNPKSALKQFKTKNLTTESLDELILSQNLKGIKTKGTKSFTASNKRINQIIKLINIAFDSIKEILGKESITDDLATRIFIIYLDEYFEHISALLRRKLSTKFLIQKIINEILVKNDEIKINTNKKVARLREKTNHYEKYLEIKMAQIESIANQAQKYRKQADYAVSNYIYDANMKMINKFKASYEVVETLISEQKLKRAAYQKLLSQNIFEQKILTELKLKAEQTLAAVLLKYDTDVGSRVGEIEAIQGDMNEEKRKFEEWKSTIFSAQEARYFELMQQKEEEENLIREERLEEIRKNHAAKVIQSGWKKYRRTKRKNLAKGGTKKKEIPKKSK